MVPGLSLSENLNRGAEGLITQPVPVEAVAESSEPGFLDRAWDALTSSENLNRGAEGLVSEPVPVEAVAESSEPGLFDKEGKAGDADMKGFAETERSASSNIYEDSLASNGSSPSVSDAPQSGPVQSSGTTLQASAESINFDHVEPVTVEKGDCLWSIAKDHLLASGVEAPSNSQIQALTESIYEANKDLIGADPDLILPGMELDIPQPDSPAVAMSYADDGVACLPLESDTEAVLATNGKITGAEAASISKHSKSSEMSLG